MRLLKGTKNILIAKENDEVKNVDDFIITDKFVKMMRDIIVQHKEGSLICASSIDPEYLRLNHVWARGADLFEVYRFYQREEEWCEPGEWLIEWMGLTKTLDEAVLIAKHNVVVNDL